MAFPSGLAGSARVPWPVMSHTPAFIPQIRLYQDWLRERHGLQFDSYDALWRWSVTDLDAFWQSIWDYNALQSPTPHTAVLERNTMPGAQWFPGAQINYTRQALRHVDAAHAAGMPAVVSRNETGRHRELSWPDLRRQVAALALHLKAQGVGRGDRVAAYLPNIPEAMVALLATASLGAVWSICAPDMGTNAVLDRFRQIAPKALIAVDGVHYAGRDIDRMAVLAELRAGLPSVEHVVLVPNLDLQASLAVAADYGQVTARDDAATAAFEPEWLPFDHPLWIVYSSGTTGLPKPIVHGHGGMVLVALQLKALHNDVGCSYHPNSWGERYHWYSSTGWVMWNAQVSGLLGGTTCVIFDGSPGGSKDRPDWGVLWRFAAETGVTSFGSGAAFYANCMKAGVDLAQCGDLSRIRSLGTTGSPLSPEVQSWGTAQFASMGRPDIWWNNISGGTDFAGAFIGGHRELPQQPGIMQCRQLGAAVEGALEGDHGRAARGMAGDLDGVFHRLGARGQAEVAVGVLGAHGPQRQVAQALQDLALAVAQLLQRIAGLAGQARAVGIHVAHGDALGSVGILQRPPGQALLHARVPGHAALAHLLRHHGGAHGFGDGGELEHRVRIHGQRRAQTAHAHALGIDQATFMHHRHGHAGHARAPHLRAHLAVELIERTLDAVRHGRIDGIAPGHLAVASGRGHGAQGRSQKMPARKNR